MDSNASSIPEDKLEKMQKLAGDISVGDISGELSPSEMAGNASPASPGDVEKWELSEDEETGQVHVSSKKKNKKSVTNSLAEEVVHWKHWFKLPAFYIYGFVYMCVRLLVNVQSVLFWYNSLINFF